MIIIGIDPGTIYTGFGIIRYEKNNFACIDHGLVKLPVSMQLPSKLEIIYDELARLIKLYKPDEFAIETAFYGKNVQSAMKIKLNDIKGLSSHPTTTEYELRFYTNPDHEIVKFADGVGITGFQYVHHGTISETNLRLIEFHKGTD